MSVLLETAEWVDEIYQIKELDPVHGGPPDLSQGLGITNVPAQQLANRTAFLKLGMTALEEREIATGVGLSGGGDLSADRTIAVIRASEAEAEAGENHTKIMTALRVAQAIKAQVTGIGIGEQWVDMMSARDTETAYVNARGRPLMVIVRGTRRFVEMSNDGTSWGISMEEPGYAPQAFVVPDGVWYRVIPRPGSSLSLDQWWELR